MESPKDLENTKDLNISVAGSRNAKKWKNQIISLSDFIQKLSEPVRTKETMQEYLSLPKSQQDEIKDVGGFVGGHLKGGLRGRENVQNRHVITLDADYCENDFIEQCKAVLLKESFTLYSTHKHRPGTMRIRVLVYPNRPLSVDEYPAVARRIASKIGINQFDDTTYDTNRLMYWPSCPSDGHYVFLHNDGAFIDVDKILKEYGPDDAWRDFSLWPTSEREQGRIKSGLSKQGDPTTKKGVVGAFCRVFDVPAAIKEFLADVYRLERGGRYSFVGGSTSNGLVIYEGGKFAYSNHGTDPAGGMLCNAFDLVRVHLFGEQDKDCSHGTPINRLPSYMAMKELAKDNDSVKVELVRSGAGQDTASADDFEEICDIQQNDNSATIEKDWEKRLQISETGIKPTLFNAVLICENDPFVSMAIKYNELLCRSERVKDSALWSDSDTTKVRRRIGAVYNVDFPREKIESAIELVAERNKYHPVREYLLGLPEWDGVERVDRLFVDVFGAEDNEYTRQVARCWMVAAVYRAMKPGYKFDNVPVLGGIQGIGKSTFLRALSPSELFVGELHTFDPQRAQESMMGRWLMEINEMGAANRQDLELQKSFLSATSTTVRMAYARHPKEFPRQCVFLGTTNESEYLKDMTGNRRWWPVDTQVAQFDQSAFDRIRADRDQLWAEAFTAWACCEETQLTGEGARIAIQMQGEKMIADEWAGIIGEFLESKADKGRYDPECFDSGELEERDRVCVLEIIEDCLGINDKTKNKMISNRIGQILSKMEGWKKHKAMKFGKRFGPQKGWVKSSYFDTPF